MKISELVVIAAFVFALVACDDNSTVPPNGADKPVSTAKAAAGNAAAEKSTDTNPQANASMWKGNAKGYVADGDPATDNVAYLVNVGIVDAHFGAFKDMAQNRSSYKLSSSEIAALIDDRMRNAYISVEARGIAETAVSMSLSPDIDALVAADMLQAIDADPRGKLPNWSRLGDRFRNWRQDAIVGVKGRHHRQVLLARSALLRMAGDAFALGLDANGNVVNPVQKSLGHGYIQAAQEPGMYLISLCDLERDATTETRHASNDLDNRIYDKKANAGDVYDFAETVEKRAASLSADGKNC